MPANIFYGTNIPTCILVLKKNRASARLGTGTAHSDNILFIDAGKHFEKVKTQNELRKADIDKIIRTYKNLTAEAKYSYVAPLVEVAENDFNLNIPRYVNTFDEEETVDLTAVAQELKDLEKDISTTDQTIVEYCAPLGMETPF